MMALKRIYRKSVPIGKYGVKMWWKTLKYRKMYNEQLMFHFPFVSECYQFITEVDDELLESPQAVVKYLFSCMNIRIKIDQTVSVISFELAVFWCTWEQTLPSSHHSSLIDWWWLLMWLNLQHYLLSLVCKGEQQAFGSNSLGEIIIKFGHPLCCARTSIKCVIYYFLGCVPPL